MHAARIVKVECAALDGRRPRLAGSNARLPSHGSTVRVPLVRLTTEDGGTGFGFCGAHESRLESLIGQRLDALFTRESGVPEKWRPFEFPIWDLVGQIEKVPVYALAAAVNGYPAPSELRVPCYDTSLYIDDLHLPTTAEAVDLLVAEAEAGYANGHRAFKIKVGRGARHMPLQEGTDRDIAIVRAVREAVGPDCPLMIDANNGYNLNLAKQVLLATQDCNLLWLEEAFHEDPVLYRDLKEWQAANGLSILIADGEGEASSRLIDWAKEGLIDVIQYDIFGYGFSKWLETGRSLDQWRSAQAGLPDLHAPVSMHRLPSPAERSEGGCPLGVGDRVPVKRVEGVRANLHPESGRVRPAPHHYGCHYGNYAACHLAPALPEFTFAEWDEAVTPGLDTSAYSIEDGLVLVPDLPGFGLTLDEETFQRLRSSTFEV